MKPFIALAASAPFLLLAGVGHAASFSFADPNCSSFTIDASGMISCVTGSKTPPTTAPTCSVTAPSSVAVNTPVTISANCSPGTITGYVWTGTPTVSGQSTSNVTFADPGNYIYTVKGTNEIGTGAFSPEKTITVTAVVETGSGGGGTVGSCPSTPANTAVVYINGKDVLSPIEFNRAFDGPGNKIDSRTESGQIKSWEFDNNAFLNGKITGTHGNYGQNIKDWSISACPGDFSTDLAPKCRKIGYSDVSIYYHASDATKGCLVPPGQKMYLNVRATESGLSAGYIVGNVPSAKF